MTVPVHTHDKPDSTNDSLIPSDSAGIAVLPDQQLTPMDIASGMLVGTSATPPITDVLYVTEPGDTSAISVADIHQGGLADCFLLASIGELALFHPASITSMIHPNGNGTETVSLHTDANGGVPIFGSTAFKSIAVTVPDSFSPLGVNGPDSASQDIIGTQQEIWPQVLEEAYAYLNNGYAGIANGGSPVIAMEELTGQAAIWTTPQRMSWASLLNHISQGDLLTFDTASRPSSPYALVPSHAYMFAGVDTTRQTLQLLNPWGFGNPQPIPFSQLKQAGIVEIDIGHVAPPLGATLIGA